jgi:uncharacterized protein YkwD
VTGIGQAGSITFTGVVAERAGSTRLAVTYTSAGSRTARISVNGGIATAVRFPGTRGTNRPATARVTVTLQAGDNAITFGNPAGAAPDLDKLVLTTDGTPPTAVPTVTATGSAAPTPSVSPTTTTTPPTTTPPTTTPPTTTPPPPTTSPPDGNAAFEADVVALVNEERAKAGCPAVAANDLLQLAARRHSADMAARSYFSHTTPEGVQFATRITEAGYVWRSAGENIAKGYRTPEAVMTGWMNSAGHKANILNCGFRDLGVGVAAEASGTLLWTQDFATAR